MPFPSSPGGSIPGADFSFNQAVGMAAGFDAYTSGTSDAAPTQTPPPPPPAEVANQTTTPISHADGPQKVRRIVRKVVKKKPPSTPE